jgi:hypothetical protein
VHFLISSASSSSVFFLYIVLLPFSWISVYFVAFLFLFSSPSLISFPHALQSSCRIAHWVSASVTLLWTWIIFLTRVDLKILFDPFIVFISVQHASLLYDYINIFSWYSFSCYSCFFSLWFFCFIFSFLSCSSFFFCLLFIFYNFLQLLLLLIPLFMSPLFFSRCFFLFSSVFYFLYKLNWIRLWFYCQPFNYVPALLFLLICIKEQVWKSYSTFCVNKLVS